MFGQELAKRMNSKTLSRYRERDEMESIDELESVIVSILGQEGKLAQIFRHYEYRPEQITMSKAVSESLLNEIPLLVEAGTGTGKTLAYLIPAICSSKKMVISTGTKNLQEQIYYKDIPLMHTLLKKKFRVCKVKGRENYLCQRRWKDFSRRPRLNNKRVVKLFQKMQSWVLKTKFGDRSEIDFLRDNDPLWQEVNSKRDFCLGQKCGHFRECFITRLRQEAVEADLLIVNHHLFFSDLVLKDTTPSEVLPRYEGVIFDEAHQLEDIATEYFGLSVSNYQILELIRDTGRELELAGIKDSNLTDTLNLLNQRAGAFFGQFPPGIEKKRLRPDLLSESLMEQYQRFISSLEILSSQLAGLKSKTEPLHACQRRCQEIQGSLHFIMDMSDPEFVYWIESRTKAVFLHASPIDVSQELKRLLFQKIKRIVLTSATLSVDKKFDYIKSRLGLESPEELVLQSHFDYSRQAIIYVPTHLPAPQHEEFITQAAEEILRIVRISKGRAFILFTSYKNLSDVYQSLQGKLSYRILRQGDRPKTTLLMEFKHDVHSILLATTSFWQGVDVQGEALSCVVIDKLPFAVPTEPLVEARIDYLRQAGENAFFTYQVPRAIINLRQGVGRLIRNRQDRGLLCILDHRLVTKAYGKIFLQNLPECPIIRDLQGTKTFFSCSPGL